MSNPKVSVIVNFHNGEKYLRQCLDSIIEQDFKDLEIILWDNNSNDDSSKIIKSYCLPENTQMRINDMFIVKYNHDQQNELALHQDGSTFSFNILLNPSSEFEGGGTYFEHFQENVKTEAPALILFPSNYAYSHRAMPVISGTKYAIVTWLGHPFDTDGMPGMYLPQGGSQ